MIAAVLLALFVGPAHAMPRSAGGQRPDGQETISEIRVQGNATMSDEAVVALAAVSVGSVLQPGDLDAITKRLRDSGRFDDVDVRKRYRSLEMDRVALLLVVHEKPGVTASGQPPSVLRTIRSKLLFFPIVGYDAGYGWTYGMRTTMANAIGKGTALRLPLSWGASKEATAEIDRTFASGPLTRAIGSFGVTDLHNPHFSVDDRRTGARGRVERRFFDRLTFGGELTRTNVAFGGDRDHIWTSTLDATYDTRREPTFPVDAILTEAAWTELHGLGPSSFGGPGAAIAMYTLDGRAYKRIYRQNVLALWTRYDTASAPLPDYEERLLDGTWIRGVNSSLFAGDKRLIWSAEVRSPITTPLNDLGRMGIDVFMDGGAVAPYGSRLADQREVKSAGGGVWVIFTLIQLNFDIAHSLNGEGTSFHFGTGFNF